MSMVTPQSASSVSLPDGSPQSGAAANPSSPAAPVPRAGNPPSADGTTAARGFLQDLGGALHRLATLRIVTVVGEVAVSGSGTDITVTPQSSGAVEAASTEMNMLDGEITNVFTPKFSSLDGGALYQFHQAQVSSSVGLFGQHLAALRSLASDLLAARR